ncbi:MAG: transposase [Betaproteobacteria bacterium]
MPRHARLRLPGYPLHVIQRGHNRACCFRAANDFATYLGLLEESCDLYECNVHAYVLMPNHVHLLVTPEEPENISQAMRRLGQRYVQHFNKAHGRTGAMWEGRFKSIPVDSRLYLLKCQRYIEQNPLRARLVEHPRDYPWSSYRYNAEGWPSTLVRPHAIFREMVGDDGRFIDSYRDFLREAPDEEELGTIRKGATYGGASPGCVPGVRPRVRRPSPS